MALFYKGDNLKAMQLLPKESIDFIYLDPPFFTMDDQGDYDDSWKSMDEYLDFLRQRLVPMKALLKKTGLIAVHLDWHAVHYVKVLMDEIFGYNYFVNELIWCYKSGGSPKKSFARKHDTILLYSKSHKYYFKPQLEKSYNRGFKPYHFKDVAEYEDERGWYTLVNHKDVLSFDMVGRTSSERTGYSTQKPEKLLSFIMESCCPEGGLVADFFSGSGTTAVCAAKSGRDFVICDEQYEALRITAKRLCDIGMKFDIISI